MHWDDICLEDSAELRFDEEDKPDGLKKGEPKYWREERNGVHNAAEGWVRFWHQVLMEVQLLRGGEDQLSFCELVQDLKDYYNSACAMLLSSQHMRLRIKAMIRWQQEELAYDEEDFEEWKEEEIHLAMKQKHEKAAQEGGSDQEMES